MASSRLTGASEKLLLDLGFSRPMAYQPQHLFVKNGRRHERVAEPGDPWLVSAAYGDRCISAVAASPAEGASKLIRQMVMPELHELGEAVAGLTMAIQRVR
jgi:hypothetical protein